MKYKSHYHLNNHSQNVFYLLKAQNSILLTLFGNDHEIINKGAQAPSPSKNYCQLIMNTDNIILRWWQISIHSNSDSRYPGESISNYEDFVHDEMMQRII